MKSNKENSSKKKQSPVIIDDGKWTTQDGMSFNTATKAWNHTKELSPVVSLGSEEDPETEHETNPEPEDPDPNTEPDSDPE